MRYIENFYKNFFDISMDELLKCRYVTHMFQICNITYLYNIIKKYNDMREINFQELIVLYVISHIVLIHDNNNCCIIEEFDNMQFYSNKSIYYMLIDNIHHCITTKSKDDYLKNIDDCMHYNQFNNICVDDGYIFLREVIYKIYISIGSDKFIYDNFSTDPYNVILILKMRGIEVTYRDYEW